MPTPGKKRFKKKRNSLQETPIGSLHSLCPEETEDRVLDNCPQRNGDREGSLKSMDEFCPKLQLTSEAPLLLENPKQP